MISTRYISIDKNIVSEGISFDFNIFCIHDNDEVKPFKNRGNTVTRDDYLILKDVRNLYIKESENEDYETFYKKYLAQVPQGEYPNIENKSGKTYTKASSVLDAIFENPETLGNYKDSKLVVNDLIDTVLDNDFTIRSLMGIAAHDYHTHTHSLNVAIYALSLGSYIGLDDTALSELGEAALLHDLGKSKVDPKLINKKGRLTDEEFAKAKQHSSLGYALGMRIGIRNKNVLLGIRHHHEKMDGSGYPSGLKQNQIPHFARIIGLCDIFDALTSKRSYKEAMTTFDALKLIKLEMKAHVDPKLLLDMIMMFKNESS